MERVVFSGLEASSVVISPEGLCFGTSVVNVTMKKPIVVISPEGLCFGTGVLDASRLAHNAVVISPEGLCFGTDCFSRTEKSVLVTRSLTTFCQRSHSPSAVPPKRRPSGSQLLSAEKWADISEPRSTCRRHPFLSHPSGASCCAHNTTNTTTRPKRSRQGTPSFGCRGILTSCLVLGNV